MNIPAKDWYNDSDLAKNYRKDLLEQAFKQKESKFNSIQV